ncbi:MAG: GNAT family N-acetyltransferase [Ruminococcus sp.]|nr:GNAT family N-acetyltransferase [Ruminococcus sp.]MBP3797269.1 GNAT family N-acetyltransferase [Ruminococcus sp.]
MKIEKASIKDTKLVKHITQATIRAVYPHYYPEGAVDFFSAHHSDERIISDIEQGRVYLIFHGEIAVGTVTVADNEINRLFVLQEYQGQGFGRALMDFAEKEIACRYDEIKLDASLPAKAIYKNRGYEEISYNMIKTDNGDYLCYDEMVRKI